LAIEIFLSALLMTLLGLAYVKGYDVVKRHSPEHLAHFYLIMATVRMLLVGTAVALYVLLIASDREDSLRFALTIIIMYVVMMVVTLKLRH
jgi:cytochrome c biogenesis factor